ncbi:B12-binding domain-containing radical SAM protein [Nisaea sp.]|uniref:B12-binding domain-containing radical SAM protein n=1 Tax=Nisaea sp. TaxID=2024842 RepID=UPI002B266EC8|nr:cobalamin-dependent protein [Nisaea sp.]
MIKKRLVQLVDITLSQTNNPTTLPYATSVLKAYVESFADIRDNFTFSPTIFIREEFDTLVDRAGQPDILALSCYVWNFNTSMALAAEVKRRSPETIVLLGGPHPKYGDDTVLAAHPAVDGIVQGEGEAVFLDILRVIAADGQLGPIDGLTFRDPQDGRIRVSQHRARPGDLSTRPSPYILGLMDSPLAELNGRQGAALLETNRGCPFQCTFCDWGSLGSKMAEFPIERVFADIDWIASNSIHTIWAADSNFGMRKRDKEIAAYLADAYQRNGYPRRLIASTSKNSSRAVLDALLPLAKTPMFRGLTLSFQTHSETALRDIKRQNIKHSAYFEMLDHARATDTRTYTEMILGLPGETLASFKEGLLVAIDRNPHSSVIVYRCGVLPNAEMASAEDRARFGLKTAWLPDRESPELDPRFIESHEIVVGTNTMPEPDWGEAVEYAWLVILLHSLRLGHPALLLLRHVMGLDYVAIFDGMLSLLRQRPDCLLGAQLQYTQRAITRFQELRDPTYRPTPSEDLPWRADPDASARISRVKLADFSDQCAAELTMLSFTVAQQLGHPIDVAVRDDLFLILQHATLRPVQAFDRVLEFKTNLPEVLDAAGAGRSVAIKHGPRRYRITCSEEISSDAFQDRIKDNSDLCIGLDPLSIHAEPNNARAEAQMA